MKIHVVKKGDTLYLLAQKYHVGLDELIAFNPQIANPDEIDIGMKVKIPSSPVAVNPPSGMMMHTVQQGDTLWKLSKQTGVSLDAMIAANPQLKNPSVLMTGETVYIPQSSGQSNAGPATGAQVYSHPGKVSTAPISAPAHPGKVSTAPIPVPTPAPIPAPVPLTVNEVEFFDSTLFENMEPLKSEVVSEPIEHQPLSNYPFFELPKAGMPMKTDAIQGISGMMQPNEPMAEPVTEMPFAQYNIPAAPAIMEKSDYYPHHAGPPTFGGVLYDPCAPVMHPCPPMMPMDMMGMMNPYDPYGMMTGHQMANANLPFPSVMPAEMMICPPGFVPYHFGTMPMALPQYHQPCGCGGSVMAETAHSPNAPLEMPNSMLGHAGPQPPMKSGCNCDSHHHHPGHMWGHPHGHGHMHPHGMHMQGHMHPHDHMHPHGMHTQGHMHPHGHMHPLGFDYSQPNFLSARETSTAVEEDTVKTAIVENTADSLDQQTRELNKKANKTASPTPKRKPKKRAVIADYSSGPWLNV